MPDVVLRYTRVAILLHWLIAALIVGNVMLVWVIDLLPEAMERPVIDTHKSLGLTVLGLAVMRLLWRATHRAPALPASYSRLERGGAHAAHFLLYALIFALPLSGYLHDSAFKDAAAHPLTLFGLVGVPRLAPAMALDPAAKERFHTLWFEIHSLLAYVLYVALAAHILGALKHQLIDREPELERMLPGRRPRSRRLTDGAASRV